MFRSMISSRRMTRFSAVLSVRKLARYAAAQREPAPWRNSSSLSRGRPFSAIRAPIFRGLVPDQRERAGRIHGHRRQHRINVLHQSNWSTKAPLLFRQILVARRSTCSPFCFKRRKQGTVVGGILQIHQLMGCFTPISSSCSEAVKPGDICLSYISRVPCPLKKPRGS